MMWSVTVTVITTMLIIYADAFHRHGWGHHRGLFQHRNQYHRHNHPLHGYYQLLPYYVSRDNNNWNYSVYVNQQNGRPMYPGTIPNRTIKPITVPATANDLQSCIKLCPVTAEYNPVCGTDHVTYNNLGHLNCAKHCGVDVTVLQTSKCPSNSTMPESTTKPSTPPAVNSSIEITSTTPNAESNNQITPRPLSDDQTLCIGLCIDSYETKFVCGTDNVTYINAEHLLCAQSCGVNVKLKNKSKCDEYDSGISVTTSKTTTETIRDLNSEHNSWVPYIIHYCLKKCSVTLEYNPACGTNNGTYKNPNPLQCLVVCGMNFPIKEKSQLPPVKPNEEDDHDNLPTATGSTERITEQPETSNVTLCIDACVADTTSAPLCGSNGVTYKNLDEFLCVQSCNVDVSIVNYTACEESVMPSSEVTTKKTTSAGPETTTSTEINFQIDPRFGE